MGAVLEHCTDHSTAHSSSRTAINAPFVPYKRKPCITTAIPALYKDIHNAIEFFVVGMFI